MHKKSLLRIVSAVATGFLLSPSAWAVSTPIRIAFPSGMNGQIVVTMDKAGIAKKEGLDPTFSEFQYGPPMMEALAAGSIDAVVTSLMPVTSYAAKLPGDVRIAAMLGHSSYSLMVAKDRPDKGPADLAGQTIGVSFGSDSHLDTMVWLKAQGLADKARLVNIAPEDMVTSLAEKSVDAIVIRQPQVLRLQQQTGARVLHTWPFRFLSIVKDTFITEQPQAYHAYLKALQESLFYIAQHHQQAATWFGADLRIDPNIVMAVSQEDSNYDAKSLGDIDISVTPAARAMITKWVDDAYANKIIKSKVDSDKLF